MPTYLFYFEVIGLYYEICILSCFSILVSFVSLFLFCLSVSVFYVVPLFRGWRGRDNGCNFASVLLLFLRSDCTDSFITC